MYGIDINSRQRVYKCTGLSSYGRDHFTMNGFEYEENKKYIKCPICKKREYINFNGKDGTEFICVNKKKHKDNQNYRFTILYAKKEINLKNFIIQERDYKTYEKLHEIYTKAKKSSKTIFDIKLVNECLELGLNEKVISGIFATSQSTLNRFIHSRELYKHKNRYFIKVNKFADRIFYTTMSIDNRYYT